MVVGENLADLSSLTPAPYDMCGAMGAATGIVGVSLFAKKPVHASVRGPGNVDLGSRGTSDVRLLVLTDDH